MIDQNKGTLKRGTSAHSTLEIDGRDSSEIWDIFE